MLRIGRGGYWETGSSFFMFIGGLIIGQVYREKAWGKFFEGLGNGDLIIVATFRGGFDYRTSLWGKGVGLCGGGYIDSFLTTCYRRLAGRGIFWV